MPERAVRVVISGRVQGVGYRAWTERRAARHGLAGWVRNRRDGSVEAMFKGEAGAVETMLAACKAGPAGADVGAMVVEDIVAVELTRFTVLPTE